ncbi:selenocysteine-specific translation elongation factor [Rhodopila sp.]|uniref:selenocysteine-specific translation elongation factor n=1 Tax=Rhodopila sp. TaxID=2480087 RepID=UPI002C1F4048|nr:selenocysteine-specific translation elongation factor [Rhodopila sp.]HVZ09284.1 selenocysteine-specific translation elongation factor [Rhodopila sp.]
MIIGTAGHVDHGKTALVKALTGVDTDRLAEEKRRGITIDLGYAYTDDFGFVDVPGHERFVHTMLAGASGIDTGLLVVDLTEGIRPQTREHLQILSLLGIETGVVALTKADLAPERTAEVSAALRPLLAETRFRDAPMIPVSAVTGMGLETLRAALVATARPPRPVSGHPRLAVDRAFTLTGAGLIVTGTLVAGRIAVEDRLVLSPVGLEVRVRGLHAQNRPAREAVAAQRVALNITGPRVSKDAVRRGDWVLHPALHAPTAALDARLRLLPDAVQLRPDTEVHLHLGTAHGMARLSLLDRDRLTPGDTALVRLTLREPIGALARDRFVIRDTSATHTLGGGTVLDPFPPRRGRRTAARLVQLVSLDASDPTEALRGLLAVTPHWTDAGSFFRAWNLPEPAQAEVIAAAPARPAGGLLLSPEAFVRIRDRIVAMLDAHHRSSPELPGMQAERLRIGLPERPPAAAFGGIVQILVADGVIAQDGPWLRQPHHSVMLSAQDQRIWRAAEPLITGQRFRPPRLRELAETLHVPEKEVRATLKRLQRMGQLVEVPPDLFFRRDTMAEMVAIAADLAEHDGVITAASFRDRLENGRKVAILVLEFLDRAGVTVRTGDTRRIRPERLRLFGEPSFR